MSVTMSGNFYPSIWNVDNGGLVHLDLNVTFDSTPPASFDYTIWFKDSAGNILKEWSGTKLTNGQPTTSISVNWDGKENGVKVAPYGPCRFYARITYPEGSEFRGFCNGIAVVPIFETESPSIDDIGAFTGAYKLDIVDISIPDLGIPLTVERFYSSLYSYGEETLRFGGWMFNFHEQIVFDDDDGSYIVVFPNRREIRFLKQNNLYVPATSNTYEKLEDSPDGTKILTMKNGWKHYFRKMVDFNEVEFLIRIENRLGQGIDYFWQRGDFEGFPGVYLVISKIVSLTGRELIFTYENLGEYLQISVEDWVGRKHKYMVSNIGNEIVQSIDMEGNTTVYGRDDSDLGGYEFSGIRSLTRPNGKILSNTGCGISPVATRVKTQIPDIGDTFEYDYDWINYATTVTRGSRKWEYQFSREQGLLSYYKDPAGNITQYEYDQYGNKTKETDSQGRTTIYTWDDKGNMLSITDPLGNITTFEYNEYGQKTKQTIGEDLITTWEFDSLSGNIVKKTEPGNNQTNYEYFENGLLKKVVPSKGRVTEYEYDCYGNAVVIKTEDRLSEYNYDGIGQLIKEINSNGDTCRYNYNNNGDLIRKIFSDGSEIKFDYDGNRNLIRTKSSAGVSEIAYNSMNDPISILNLDSSQLSLDYDEYSQLVSRYVSPEDYENYQYDELGRLILKIDNSGRSKQFIYGDKTVEIETSPDGKATTKTFGQDGGLITTEYNDGSFAQTKTDNFRTVIYQTGSRFGEISYGGSGYGSQQFGNDKYGGSFAKYGFDPKDAIEQVYNQENKGLQFVKYPLQKVIGYEYNQETKSRSVTDIRGYKTTYFWDESGRTDKVVYRCKEISYTYDDERRISAITTPNGITKTITYKESGNDTIKSICYEKNTYIILHIELFFENSGNISGKSIEWLSREQKKFEYKYDVDSKLVSVYRNGELKMDYSYDNKGNLIQKRDDMGKTTSLYYDSSNRLILNGDKSYYYDLSGRLIEAQKVSSLYPEKFVYDNQEKLAMVITAEGRSTDSYIEPLGGYVWRYRYYPDGTPSKIISPSGRELRFYYDGGLLINEEGCNTRKPLNSNGQAVQVGINPQDSSKTDCITHIVTWFYGADSLPLGIDTTPPHSSPDEETINWYLTDEKESILGMVDSSGNLIRIYEYDEQGKRLEIPLEPSIKNPHTVYNPLGYQGKHKRKLSDSNKSADDYKAPDAQIIKEFDAEIKRLTDSFRKNQQFGGINYVCYTHAYMFSNELCYKKITINNIKLDSAWIVGRYPEYSPIFGQSYKITMFKHFGVIYRLALPNGNTIYYYHDYNDENRGYNRRFYSEWWYEGQSTDNVYQINKNSKAILKKWDQENRGKSVDLGGGVYFMVEDPNTFFPKGFSDSLSWANLGEHYGVTITSDMIRKMVEGCISTIKPAIDHYLSKGIGGGGSK